MNISLPEELKQFVDKRANNGSYGSASEYVRELIRRDLGLERFRNMLLEGMNSPIAAEVNDQFFADLRAKFGISPDLPDPSDEALAAVG